MNIFITGGLGFIGRKLSAYFLENGHRVVATGLRENPPLIHHESFRYISADTSRRGDWQREVASADVVVNLAGKTLFHRWTKRYKKEMYDSRILTTRHVVEALSSEKDTILISTSAVGYYGDGKDQELTEEAHPGDDFLAHLSVDWESEALKAVKKKNVRIALPRFGIVLDADGGAMGSMISAFSWLVGGKLGSGEQWFPWIHITDLIRAYGFLLDNPDFRGPFNLCSPHPIKNRELTRLLAQVLDKPAVMPAPRFMMKLVMGEMSDALLNSLRVIPKRLLDHGYEFRYPRLHPALSEIIERQKEGPGEKT